MRLLQYSLLLASVVVQLVHSKVYNGTYIALCPSFLRPGLPFTVSLNILKPGKNYVAQMEIRNSQNRRLATMVKKNIKFGQPTILRIDEVPTEKLTNYNEQYHVYIKGKSAEGSVLFENKQNVILIPKSVSIFVQTDKAVYIPDSTVKFRAIVVKPDLKPYQETVTVKIMDPRGTIVKQWLDSKLNTGVYSKSLKLANDPPLGDWKIFVETKNGEQLNQTFSVEKYVLPKFDVSIDLPTVVTIEDPIVITVNAKYTYGKRVDGSVLLMACNTFRHHCSEEDKQLGIFMGLKRKNINKSGKAIFRFTKRDLSAYEYLVHQLSSYDQGQIQFTASVTENLTGIKRTETEVVSVCQSHVNIKIKPFKDAFMPGLPNKFLIVVKRHDGHPIRKGLKRNVKLTITYLKEFPATNKLSGIKKHQSIYLKKDGTKIVEVVPPVGIKYTTLEAYYEPSENGRFVSQRVKYKLRDRVDMIPPRKSPTNTYLEVLSNQVEVQVGQKVKFEIKATDNGLKFGTLQVMSRGNIVMSKEFAIMGKSRSIEFTATTEMAPKSRLVAFAMREDNKEILADSAEFHVSGMFKNKVTLSVNKRKVKNNEKVKIRVQAKPNSFVGIAAIDKRSQLLKKKNNDITAKMIASDNERFSNTTCKFADCKKSLPWLRKTKISPPLRRQKRSSYLATGIDAYETFEKAGLFVLTDTYLYRQAPEHTSIIDYDELLFDWEHDVDDVSRSLYSYSDKKAYPTHLIHDDKSMPVLRRKFPETWIWMDSKSGSNGELIYEATVPDTITSWAISAFAIQQDAGLGIADDSVMLESFRPFFIQLNLPYSIKRGEKLGLQVLVFNYQKSKQSVTLTLKHNRNSGFDFVKKSGKILKPGKGNVDKYYNVRTVKVPGNGGSMSVFFPIIATKIGEIKVHVTAIGTKSSDAVEKYLLVESEGFRVKRAVPVTVLVNKRKATAEKTVTPMSPNGAVPGSEKSSLVVTGDPVGPALYNIEEYVDVPKPNGCGEQNMASFCTNAVALRYLRETNRLTNDIKNRVTQNIETGFQNELKFRHEDNSYSLFDEDDDEGSTWLTAYVVRALKLAQPFIPIEEDDIQKSIKFIMKRQANDGSFEEHGSPYSKEMNPSASKNGIPLTSYVLATLITNGQKNPEAVRYIEQGLNKVKDKPYSLALASYALHLAGSPKKDEALKLLETSATKKNGMISWHIDYEDYVYYYDDEDSYEDQSMATDIRPVDIETTGYALLTYVLRNQLSDAEPVARWLREELNTNDGYSMSTQDTVVALQALTAYYKEAYNKNNLDRVEVDVKNGRQKQKLIIDKENALTQQSLDLRSTKSPIHFKATGKGALYAQVQYSYHTTKTHKGLTFDCNKDVTQKKGGAQVMLGICCKYKKKGESNMALMEIEALSGYTFDADEINKLKKKKSKIQRVELEKDDTKTNLYFSYLNHRPICVNITSRRTYPVAEQKEARVILYDYYEPSDRIEASYSANEGKPLSKSCPHCWDGIEKKSGKCKDVAENRCKQLSAKYCNRNNRLADWMNRKCRKLCKRC